MKYKSFSLAHKSFAVLLLSATALQLSQVTAKAQTVHTVTAGDTLYNIAARYNLSVDELKQLNQLSSDIIYLNQSLKINDADTEATEMDIQVINADNISEATVTSELSNHEAEETTDMTETTSTIVPVESTPAESLELSDEISTENTVISQYHTVQAGDNLYRIALNYNTSIDNLKKWNNLTSDFLQIGDTLVLNEVNDDNSEKNTPEKTIQTDTYTVKAGDSLWAIANKFDVTIQEIKEWNNLTSNFLQIGDTLVLKETNDSDSEKDNPKSTENTNTYTVKAGDSLWAIANKFNVTIQEIKEWNNLTSDFLQIGDTLVLNEVNDDNSEKNTPEKTIQTDTYTVKAGDSLWAIANKFDVTIQEIKEWNNLTSNFLQIGDTLVLKETNESDSEKDNPKSTENTNTYTVKAGDSLWAIANKFDVTIQEIKEWNNLKSSFLQIGDTLMIKETNENDTKKESLKETVETHLYTVKSGDSLWKISHQYNVPMSQLFQWNNLTSNILQIGQQLTIHSFYKK